MSIADGLYTIMTNAGVTQYSLAKSSGVPQPTIQRILSGETKRPQGDTLIKLADALGVSIEAFYKGGQVAEKASEYITNIAPGPEIKGKYPLISSVQAGNWSEIVDNFQPGDADEWLPCPVKCSDSTFILRVKGISMEPKFHDGEMIFVDPEAECRNGSFVVVRQDDSVEATFKQFIEEGGKRYLKALNPAWPEPIIEINGNATVCGVVVFKGEVL